MPGDRLVEQQHATAWRRAPARRRAGAARRRQGRRPARAPARRGRPVEDVPRAFAQRAAPTALARQPAACRRSVERPRRCRPISTLSKTVSSGKTLVRWKVRTRPSARDLVRLQAVERRAAEAHVALRSACRKPVITLNAVVLPAPFGPIRPTISPSWTSKFRSAMATRPPKCTATCSIDRSRDSRLSTRPGSARRMRREACGSPGRPARRGDQRATAGTIPCGRTKMISDHERAVEIHCASGATQARSATGRRPKIEAADDRAGKRAFAAGDHHDHHRHGVEEQENVGVDDPQVMRVEAAGGAGDRGRDDRREHEIAGDVDADRDARATRSP